MDTMPGQQCMKSLWFLLILRFYLMAEKQIINAFVPISGPFSLLSFFLELHFFCFLHRSNNRNLYCCHLVIISSKKVILRTHPKEHMVYYCFSLLLSTAMHLICFFTCLYSLLIANSTREFQTCSYTISSALETGTQLEHNIF